MELTLTQKTTLRNDIIAKQASGQPLNGLDEQGVANYYNSDAAGFSAWRTDADVTAITDAIDGSKYTPMDVADGSALYTNRILAIQTKQINLQTLLQGRQTINAAKVNVRKWLWDSVIAIPAGASGASVSPGGANGAPVLATCIRLANQLEKLFANASQPSDTTGATTARIMSVQGATSPQQISDVIAGL